MKNKNYMLEGLLDYRTGEIKAIELASVVTNQYLCTRRSYFRRF